MEWLVGILIIVAIAVIIYWFTGLAHMAPVLICVIAMIVVILAYIIAHYILKHIYKQKSEKLESDSNPEIVFARKLDAQNQKINESNRIAALKKKQDEYQPKIDACQKELGALKQEKAELARELSAMDCLGSKDKNVETVAYLIHQLENHRADSIKEALRQYDTHKAPKPKKAKTVYTGKDWNLATGSLSVSEVVALENDLYDLMEVLANTRDEDKLVNNWFGKLCLQFCLGCVSSNPSEKAKNDAITRNMREPNSWYLNVAGLLQGYVGTNIVMSMFSGHVSYFKEFPEALAQSEFRGAVTDRERQFATNASVVMKRLTDALYGRMQREMT